MSQQINLLNPALRPRRDWLSFGMVMSAAALALVAVLAAYAYARSEADAAALALGGVDAALAPARQELQVRQGALAKKNAPLLAREAETLAATVRDRRQVLRLAEGSAPVANKGFAEAMRGFSRQAMEGVWLTGFTLGSADFEIRGRLIEPSLLPVYIRRLNGEPAFQGRHFATLEMQGVLPAAAAPAAVGGAAAPALPKYIEFSLRATPARAGAKE